ncbi:MAG: serine hydrolase [Bryobacterales bacterium]|nr:serine hydrolase [Bryobacterales bacterium]
MRNRWMCAAALLAALTMPARAQTGAAVPELAELDRRIEAAMRKWELPGVSAAVSYRGRLVYARGFGEADRETKRAVQPRTPFRIASMSKPVTALTLLKLQEAGKLSLDDKVFTILPEFAPLLGDPRMASITVRQLLQHTAGWDLTASGDPMFVDYATLAGLGGPFPPPLEAILAFWLQQPLDFAPGTKQVYSNFGYAVAGRVIEKVTSLPYGEAVRRTLLLPLGITRMQTARTLASAPGEARYYGSGNDLALSIFSEKPTPVPEAYGAWSIENMDAHGGWLATPAELLRIVAAADGSDGGSFLQAESYRQWTARPAAVPAGAAWYAMGIDVTTSGSSQALSHNGALSNSNYGIFARSMGGWTFALVTNKGFSDADAAKFGQLEEEVLILFGQTLSELRQWPAGDQFALFTGAAAPSASAAAMVSSASGRGGAVAPGEILSLYGGNLGPARGEAVAFAQGRFGSEQSGTRVWFDGVAGSLLYVQEGQVNVIAPFDLAGKREVRITVERNGAWASPVVLPVVAAKPGLYAAAGRALALNQDGRLNGPNAGARRGSAVALFLTGGGALEGTMADGSAQQGVARLRQTVTATVNGAAARVLYAGGAPGLVQGLAQVNIEIPQGVAPGAAQVVVTVGEGVSPAAGLFVE